MIAKKLTVFLSAGEASGDLLGAALAQKLLAMQPNIKLVGIGGDKMRSAGVETIYDISDLSMIGLLEGITKLPKLLKIKRQLRKFFSEQRPQVFCGIDYPGFNVNLAGMAKKYNIKTICYKAPSIWSWGEWRVKTVKKNVDFVAAIFPFEADAYLKHGVPAAYVGCPIVDNVNERICEDNLYEQFALSVDKKIILLLPGSRKQEITKLLALLVQSAEIINCHEEAQFVLPLASTIDRKAVEAIIKANGRHVKINIVPGDKAYSFMRIAHSGLAASGTVTLEAALLGLPLVIVYRVNNFTYWLGKKLVKVKFFALPNLLAGRQILPELLQAAVEPLRMAQIILGWFKNEAEYLKIKDELELVRVELGNGGASQLVAEKIIELAIEKDINNENI